MDLIIRNVRLPSCATPQDIGIRGGCVAAIAPHIETQARLTADGQGALAISGFVESHIHLDKAHILHRCAGQGDGSLETAIATTKALKAEFTYEDVRSRAARVLRAAVVNGTTAMQSFVEVDEAAGLRSFEALMDLSQDCADSIALRLCAFAQDGLTQSGKGETLLDEALSQGAHSVGGCPYTDADPREHVRRIMAIAQKHDCDADFHVDFDLHPHNSILPFLTEHVLDTGYKGRVAIGHATKFAVLPADEQTRLLEGLLSADILLTALPATDLFLMRGKMAPLMRYAAMGGRCALATNNVVNPFTPMGDASLLRMANLFANIEGLSSDGEFETLSRMITAMPASSLGVPSGIQIGGAADIVLIDAPDVATAIRELRSVKAGWKRGRRTFVNRGTEIMVSL